jgi:uncharacterized protein YdaU (DUF1376 family)
LNLQLPSSVRPTGVFLSPLLFKNELYISMAKDPAFLFYPGDWLGGTMGMTFEEKGAYLELLIMQWNSHRITDEYAKRVVGEKLWHRISHKFLADGSGLFNKRLDAEKEKRKKHSEKQSINAKKRWGSGNATALPLENENINEDEDVVLDRGVGEGWATKPGKDFYEMDLDETKAGAVKELFRITKNHNLTNEQLKGLWYTFKVQNFTGEKFYQSPNDVYSHFINWSKSQTINGTHKQNNSNGAAKLGTSDARTEALRKW